MDGFTIEFDIITISLIIGMIGIMSTLVFQLRDIKREHIKDRIAKTLSLEIDKKTTFEAIEKSLREKLDIETGLKELREHIKECDAKIEKLESMIFHFPKESNPNAWYSCFFL